MRTLRGASEAFASDAAMLRSEVTSGDSRVPFNREALIGYSWRIAGRKILARNGLMAGFFGVSQKTEER